MKGEEWKCLSPRSSLFSWNHSSLFKSCRPKKKRNRGKRKGRKEAVDVSLGPFKRKKRQAAPCHPKKKGKRKVKQQWVQEFTFDIKR